MMKPRLKLLIAAAFALLISMPAAFAQTPEYSRLPVTEPLDVGGKILQPGDYLIRVMPSFNDRNKVQVLNASDRSVVTTVLTVPHPLEPSEEMPTTMFVYYPAGEGQPRALRTWFAQFPEASQGGHDIVYEESRAKQLARLGKSRVVSYQTQTAELDTAPLNVITPEATVETYTYTPTPPAPPAPTLVQTPAPAAPPVAVAESRPVQMQSDTRPVEMPETASRLPLIALLGLASLAAAVALRLTRGA